MPITHKKTARIKPNPIRGVFGTVEGVGQAAVSLGVSEREIQIARRLGANGCLLGGRYDLELLLEWMKANQEALKREMSNVSPGEQIKVHKARREKVIADREEGLNVEKAWAAGKLRELGVRVDRLLDAKLVKEWPASVGLDVTSNRVLGQTLANSIMAEINGMADIWEGR